MTQSQQYIVQILGESEQAKITLMGADGHTLAAEPFTLDKNELRQKNRPEEYGRLLAQAVMKGAIGEKLADLGQVQLRLALDSRLNALHDVRWECLSWLFRGNWLPLAATPTTPFSRLLFPETKNYGRLPQTEWPLRIVVAISNPANLTIRSNLPSLNEELEWNELQRAFSPLQGLVEVERVEAPVSLDQICKTLEKKPHIFHFLGHGAFNQRTQQAALFLEDGPQRQVKIVNEEEWQRRLAMLPQLPHLVVLAACESAGRVNAGALVGMAPATVMAGVSAILAMQDKVGIEAARKFVYHFYRRLATHGQLDLAANEARSYLLDSSSWSWTIPTLFMERGAERIFASSPESLEAKPADPGETLILIPEFKGHEEAFFEIDLRDSLQERVAEANLSHIRVVWLKRTAFGPGDDDAVHRLAARYGASLVIWGWYDRSRFRACFTVTDNLFTYHAPATRAQYDVGNRLQTSEDFAVFVNQQLPRQADYFVFFTLGQLYYWAQEYEQALSAFSQAILAVAQEKNPPVELAYAYFYRGNIYAVHLQDRPAAITDYRQAAALAPAFAQAAFNLGGALRIWGNTLRAQKHEEQARVSYEEAIVAYSQAIDADPAFALAYEERGLANWEIGRLQEAVNDYEAALAQLPKAEVYNKLALALRDLKHWLEALAQFDLAVRYSPNVGHYYFNRGRLQAHLGNHQEAASDFRQYLHLSPWATNRMQIETWLEKQGDY